MIQDIAPKQYHVEFAVKEPQDDSLCFVFRGQEVLERLEGDRLLLPTCKELREGAEEIRYAFRIDGTDYYLAWLREGFLPAGYDWRSIRFDRDKRTKELTFAGATARHMDLWYKDNRFCGRCGTNTVHDDKERMVRCPKCGNLIYPKICPAVIVAVTNGDRILMSRYQNRAYKGYGLIAGFVEIGEKAEETVSREVMEEVGLKVKNIRYYGSQPWGIVGNISLGYFCALDGDDKIYLDGQELAQADWYRRGEVELAPDDYSLTNDMIQAFLRGDWN